jgi:hypothetical protein
MGEIRMSTTTVAGRATTTDVPSLMEKHPRGRGFGILSRLARVEDAAGRHVREDAEERSVVSFDLRRQDARHRRDVDGLLHFG